MTWVAGLDAIVYTKVKHCVETSLGGTYPDLYVTNSDRTPARARFPTVYVHALGHAETGKTTEGKDVEAVIYTVQVDVTAKAQNDAVAVSDAVADVMSDNMFSAVAFPYPVNAEDTFGTVARYRRVIAKDDTL